jgi:hypothetical protein
LGEGVGFQLKTDRVTPAKAGVQWLWIPAFAGMTEFKMQRQGLD